MRRLITLCFCVLASYSICSQAEFEVTITNSTPEIETAVEYCTDFWGDILISDVPIKINLFYENYIFPNLLGVSIPNFIADFEGAPMAETNYVTSLANSISGVEQNPGYVDMDIHINSAASYYFGIDGNCPSNEFDFVSVFLHEICHGLGIVSVSLMEQNVGSFGMIEPFNLLPISTSFPFEAGDLQGFPSTFDRYVVNGDGLLLCDPDNFANPSAWLGYEFTGDDLYFTGPLSTLTNDGNYLEVYAPEDWDEGSSMQHLDEASFPPSSGNSMMTPFIGQGNVEHDTGPLLLAMLHDIGWQITDPISVEDRPYKFNLTVYPNPTRGQISIAIPPEWDERNMSIEIYDMQGKLVQSESIQNESGDLQVDLTLESILEQGIYSYRITDEKNLASGLIHLIR